jgi:Tol biopolymer transport system component
MRCEWLGAAAACALVSACDEPERGAADSVDYRPDGETIYSDCENVAWSADGSRIAFVYFGLPEHGASEDDRHLRIHVVGADGEGLAVLNGGAQLSDETKLGDRMFPNFPSWLPDGSGIVFQAGTFWTENDPNTEVKEDWLEGLYVIDPATGAVRPLMGDFMSGVSPSVSPDGLRVLYADWEVKGVGQMQADLWELTLATGEKKRVTNDAQTEARAAYSRDGKRIVFNTAPDDIGPADPKWAFDVWIMNADGSGKRPLVEADAPDRDGAWSPDGRTLAVVLGNFTDDRIALVPAEGGAPRVIASASPPLLLSARNPAWSPDGSKIAFCGDGEARFGLYVMNADGTRIRGIVPFEAAAGVGK